MRLPVTGPGVPSKLEGELEEDGEEVPGRKPAKQEPDGEREEPVER